MGLRWGSEQMNSCGARSIVLIAFIGPILLGCANCPTSVTAGDLIGTANASTKADTPNVYCAGIASERESEATFLHEDDRTLHAVYVFTFKACVAWREKHFKTLDGKGIASANVRQ